VEPSYGEVHKRILWMVLPSSGRRALLHRETNLLIEPDRVCVYDSSRANGKCAYQQVQHSKILRSAHTAYLHEGCGVYYAAQSEYLNNLSH